MVKCINPRCHTGCEFGNNAKCYDSRQSIVLPKQYKYVATLSAITKDDYERSCDDPCQHECSDSCRNNCQHECTSDCSFEPPDVELSADSELSEKLFEYVTQTLTSIIKKILCMMNHYVDNFLLNC